MSVRVASTLLAHLGQQVVAGGPLGALTTYRVGGPAALLVTARQVADLTAVREASGASGLPVLVVGRGSNLLVADAGFAGIAVILDPAGFGAISVEGTSVRAGAAVPLPALARQSVEAGLSGLEWAVGVPGSVGGGVRMNAGGHGSDIAHTIRACQVVDVDIGGRVDPDVGLVESGDAPRPGPELEKRRLPRDPGTGLSPVKTIERADLALGYRTSAIGPGQVVIEATFGLVPGDREAGRTAVHDIIRWRRRHQPGGQNAGSVFTNPPGEAPADSAGWLIEAAGCKGRRWRSAMVSPKHANFIQADDGGSADDVRALMEEVRTEVAHVHGIDLHPEVRMIGFSNPRPQAEGNGLRRDG